MPHLPQDLEIPSLHILGTSFSLGICFCSFLKYDLKYDEFYKLYVTSFKLLIS